MKAYASYEVEMIDRPIYPPTPYQGQVVCTDAVPYLLLSTSFTCLNI